MPLPGQQGDQGKGGGKKKLPDPSAVGPDGIVHEKTGKGAPDLTKPDPSGSGGAEEAAANPNPAKPMTPKKPGEKPGPSDAPGPEVSQLFQPGQHDATEAAAPTGSGAKVRSGPMAGKLPRTDPGRAPLRIEEITDPTERAAAQRLQQAIQRIQTNRDRHAAKPGPGGSDPASQSGRRDW
jgi:hypothetical protein